MTPTVSILVPLYNCAPYLEQCLTSLINQTYQDISIIISDDCSTDNSYEVAVAIAARDSRITVYRQPSNTGYLDNYNFLLQKATGQFIAIQDSDDWSELTRIEKQMMVMQQRPDIVLTGTTAVFHYPDKELPPPEGRDHIINGITDPFSSVPASILFRSTLLKKASAMPLYFKGGTSMDRYFIMELLEGDNAWHIAEPLYHARVLPSSNHRTFNMHKVVTALLFDKLLEQRRTTGTDWLKSNNMEAIHKWEAEIKANRQIMSEKYREYAMYGIDGNDLGAAVAHLKKALALNPLSLLNLKTALYYLRKKFGSS